MAATGSPGFFTPASGRILDTRTAGGSYAAQSWHTISPGGAVGIPTSGVTALSVSFTTLGSTASGYLTAIPGGATRQIATSQLNWNTGETISNSALVGTASDGSFQVYVSSATQLLIDIQGYFTAATGGSAGGSFTPVPNGGSRVFDSRVSGATTGHVGAGQTVNVLTETSTSGVPSGATAVFANVTVLSYDNHNSYVTAWQTGAPRPQTSLNYAGGENTALGTTVGVNSSGQLSLYVGTGAVTAVDILVDVQGYYTASAAPGAFTPQSARVFDSRGTAALQPNTTTKVQIANVGGIPVAGSGGLGAEAVNLAAESGRSGDDGGYLVIWGTDQAPPPTSDLTVDGGRTRSNMATLVPGPDNSVNVRYVAARGGAAINLIIDAEGWYANSSSASVPSAPQSVTASATDSTAVVSFAPPVSDGGATVTSYSVTASPNGEIVSSTGGPITVSGLTNGLNYTFTVTATNAAGTGPASAQSNVVIPHPIANAPGAPTGVSATSAGSTSATVSFTAPTNTGGAPITRYTVTSSPGGATAQGSSSPITIGGLTSGQTYTFTVTATNSAGTGASSAPSNRITIGGTGGGPGGSVSCYQPSDHCWGVDILDTSPGYLDDIKSGLGDGSLPDFVGRYLTRGASDGKLTQDEVSDFHTRHVAIELLADETGGCASTSDGAMEANDAAATAHARGLNSGSAVTIFLDEDETTATAACERMYADTLVSKGYQPGFYLNPHDFSGQAYCGAIDDNNVATAPVFSDEMEPDTGLHRNSSPAFNPEEPHCGGPNSYGWQYSQSQDTGAGYDTDEFTPGQTSALWQP